MTQPPPPATKPRVIVIEYGAAHGAKLTSFTLFTLDAVASTDAAISKLESGEYDVVLVDLTLGEENGIEVISRLRQRWPSLPCVLMASNLDSELLRAAMQAGAVDHLSSEELDEARLEQTIHRALRIGRVERDLAETQRGLERQVTLLTSLVDTAARIHRSDSASAAVEISVHAISKLIEGHVRLDLEVHGGPLIAKHPPADSSAPLEHVLRVTLQWLDGTPAGELVCEREGQPFERGEELAVTQLGRTAAVAVEKHRRVMLALEQAREREALMTMVSHDLRGPLQTLALSIEALHKPASRQEADDTRERATRTVRNIWRMLDELLDVSRVHDGILCVDPRPIAAARVLQDLAAQLVAQAGERSLEIDTAEASLDLIAMADDARLHQALGNLAFNAIRYAEKRVSLRARAEGAAIRFEVIDDGPGVDPEVRTELFARSSQGRGQRGSLGVGLYIARGIARAHGGEVGFEPVPGGGSNFWLQVPIAASAEGAAPV